MTSADQKGNDDDVTMRLRRPKRFHRRIIIEKQRADLPCAVSPPSERGGELACGLTALGMASRPVPNEGDRRAVRRERLLVRELSDTRLDKRDYVGVRSHGRCLHDGQIGKPGVPPERTRQYRADEVSVACEKRDDDHSIGRKPVKYSFKRRLALMECDSDLIGNPAFRKTARMTLDGCPRFRIAMRSMRGQHNPGTPVRNHCIHVTVSAP